MKKGKNQPISHWPALAKKQTKRRFLEEKGGRNLYFQENYSIRLLRVCYF
jgi:hypothetical protein